MTFLFTDIEGSTRLWEEHPEAMRRVLAQHDDLLRACTSSPKAENDPPASKLGITSTSLAAMEFE